VPEVAAAERVTPPLREIVKVKGQDCLLLRPHEGQRRVRDSTARFVFMLAGTRGGKTSWGPHWLHQEMDKACKQPSSTSEGIGDFWAVTTTFDLFTNAMLPEIRTVFGELLGIGKYWSGRRVIELTENLVPGGRFWAKNADDKMFGRIVLRSAEALIGLEGAEVKAAWLDEVGQDDFTLQAWEAILRRLSITKGRVLGTTTLYNYGWLKREIYDKWQAGDPDYDVIQFDSTVNPAFPLDEYERARRSLPAWKFNMLYRGLFAKPVGLVYDSFDERECVIDSFIIPDNWLWHVGHDFGTANPAALCYAQDPATGMFYLVHEYLPGSMAVGDQVEYLKALLRGRNIVHRSGGSHQEEDSRQNYTQHGWHITEPSVNSVEVGIERVYAFHKRNAIKVFRDCRHYLDEKTSYSYKLVPSEGYSVTNEIENKSRYHLMDCERYALCGFSPDLAFGKGPTVRITNRF